MLTINVFPFELPTQQFLEIINVETASRVTEVTSDIHCYSGFLYNDQYSCALAAQVHEDGSETYDREVWSLSFQENFTDPVWTVAYELPEDIFDSGYYNYYGTMAVVDEMLTSAWTFSGVVHYLDGDQWKTEALEIPRDWATAVVVPCE